MHSLERGSKSLRCWHWLGVTLALLPGCTFVSSLPVHDAFHVHHAFTRRVPLTPQLTLLLGADPGSMLYLDRVTGTLNLESVTLAGIVGIEWRW